MNLVLKSMCLAVSLTGCLAVTALGQEIEQAKKAVVKITSQADGKNRVGTGFIAKLDKDAAYIVTESHVIEGDSKPKVSFYPDAETQYVATVIGTEGDLPRGLALIRVRGTLPPGLARLGIDTSNVQASEQMTIIGFPRLASTAWAVTSISIVGRQGTAITFTGAADEGSSGSPVIRNGWVTAIVAEKAGDFGYAVPAMAVRFAIEGWGLNLLQEEAAPGAGTGGHPAAAASAVASGNGSRCGTKKQLAKTRLLYLSDDEQDTIGGRRDIYTMDFDGKNVQKVTPKDAFRPHDVGWTRNGKSITYVLDDDIKTMGIYQTNLSSGNTSKLTTKMAYYFAPVWSPDGKWIAYLANTGLELEERDVFVMPSTGRTFMRLTESKSNKVSLFWSPDGKRLGFAEAGEKSSTTYFINADGTHVEKLSSPLVDFAAAEWSPDGTKLIGESVRDGYPAIYSMNYDGSDPVALTNNRKGDGDPDYSPDGCMITFVSKRDGHYEIYTMNADGSNQTRLTTSGRRQTDSPQWSPLPLE